MEFIACMKLNGFQNRALEIGDTVECSAKEARPFVAQMYGGDVFSPGAASLVPAGKPAGFLDDDKETDFEKFTPEEILTHAQNYYGADISMKTNPVAELQQMRADKWQGRKNLNDQRAYREEPLIRKFIPGTTRPAD